MAALEDAEASGAWPYSHWCYGYKARWAGSHLPRLSLPRHQSSTQLEKLSSWCPVGECSGSIFHQINIFFKDLFTPCFSLSIPAFGFISSEKKNPGLGTGWGSFVKDIGYRRFLLTVTDQKEMSSCTGLSALDHANSKFSTGYTTTGAGVCCCARHELIKRGGAHNSVPVCVGYADNTMTLYHLRRLSGRPPDYTLYTM